MLHKFQHRRPACERQQTPCRLAAPEPWPIAPAIGIVFDVMQGAVCWQVQIVLFAPLMLWSSPMRQSQLVLF